MLSTSPNTCLACGGRLDPDAIFCPRCGTACGTTALPAAPPTPTSPARPGPRASDPLLGRELIGQYVIRERIGEGGMGAVYLADQPSVGRRAVVKVLHPELSRDPTVSPRFEIEARAASQLNHPHIVTIYNYGATEDGTLFLAMEYCAGESLDAVIAAGPLPWERVASIGAQVCDALAEAHRRGVVHRDLKPSNIMLVEVGRRRDFVKVLDFGIAKVEGVRMTRTGSVVGTPQYMSPEQFRGESLDGRADLYSLGVLLYEAVAGRLPFESQSAAGFMHKHLDEEPPSPRALVPALRLPRGLEAILLCALAKSPDERFRDADEMGQALERVLHTPDHIPPTRTLPRARGRGRTRLWLGLAGGATVAAAASVGTAFLLRAPAPPPARGGDGTGALVWVTPDPGSGSGTPLPAGIRIAAMPDAAPPRASQDPPRAEPAPTRGGRATRVALARPRARVSDPVETGQTAPPPATEVTPAPAPAPAAAPTPAPAPAPAGDVDRMLAELKRLVLTARVPPSTWDTTMEGYRSALAAWPPAEREGKRRDYLVQLIALYKRPGMQLSAAERLPLARLRTIFLGMETKAGLSVDQRARILESTFATYEGGRYSAADRDYYKRMAVVSLIRRYAADPDAALR